MVQTDEERKAKRKKYDQRPEVIARRKELNLRPEYKAKRKEILTLRVFTRKVDINSTKMNKRLMFLV